MGVSRIVTDRYCDEPMARKKGYLKTCTRDCAHCHAAIEITQNREKEHYTAYRGRSRYNKQFRG